MRLLGGWGVCVLPLLALADAPFSGPARPVAAAAATEQSAPVTTSSQAGPQGAPPSTPSDTDNQPLPRHQRLGFNNASPEDLKADEQWMQENAPRRWQYYQSLVATHQPGANRVFREFILPRIHQIDWLKQNDPQLYDLRMQRVKLEDQAFGMLQDLTSATDPKTKATLRDQLKQKLGEMYDNTLAERQQRIDELTASLKNAQIELDADEKPDRRAKHVEESLQHALETGSLENPKRENGAGPRMHGGPGMMSPPPPSTQP
ncbi:MAG TPA: hypothetical protein VHY37_00880 [Tepidisphaeraceae bacterium]|nr:hypothetical protein [Tepidisphaeraceae bacterium]